MNNAVKVTQSTTPVDLQEVQGFILRGYGPKLEATFFQLEITDHEKARKWLSSLDFTSAQKAAQKSEAVDPLLNIAFSYRGLQRLGLDRQALLGFDREFIEASDDPSRARILGDLGESAPENWAWGSQGRIADLALMVYTSTPEAMSQALRSLAVASEETGTRLVVAPFETIRLPESKEHFGFRDGIAQPVVAGTHRSGDPANTIATGEFLLGHVNGYGKINPGAATGSGVSFGYNGSYMVWRQLEQDVAGFWSYLREQAAQLPEVDAITIGAKMVGRWPNGVALVHAPDAMPAEASGNLDAFGYQQTDPTGSQCPFGSHVRRTNPRDWELGADREESAMLSNRHRLLRRGRSYGKPISPKLSPEELSSCSDDGVARGLHFICFCANLARQFEFVQQQWCNNPKFAGMQSDADPLIGRHVGPSTGSAAPTFTIPTDSGQLRCSQVPVFVKTRGSSYFFAPSIPSIAYLLAQGRETLDN